jgi:hypothetical protein
MGIVFGPRSACLAASIVICLTASIAPAQEPSTRSAPQPTDEELIAQGVELRKKGQDAEALALFERANSVRRSPRAVVQIALAHQALGHWRQAETGLIEALGENDDPWISRHRVHLEESLAVVQAHLCSLQVESNIDGAEVWIGGELSGRFPLDRPLRVVAGDLDVEVRATGFPTIRQTMHVEGKSQAHATFTFALPPAPTAEPPKKTSEDERTPLEHPSSGIRAVAWISLAGAGGLALVGGAGLATREAEAQIWNDDARCGPMGGQSRADRCGTNRDIGNTALTVAIVAFVTSGVAAAVSGALFLGTSRPSRANPSPHVGCSIGTWLRCRATF